MNNVNRLDMEKIFPANITSHTKRDILFRADTDSVSGGHGAIKIPKQKKTSEGIMGIPWSVFSVIEEVESTPTMSDEDIRAKFLETGYEYAEGLAEYHIDKRKGKL